MNLMKNIFLIVSTFIIPVISQINITNHKFTLNSGYRFEESYAHDKFMESSIIEGLRCLSYCSKSKVCRSAIYTKSTSNCSMYTAPLVGYRLEIDPSLIFFEKKGIN